MKPTLALVTGASSGIGKAISELLAEKGVNLILSGRNMEALRSLQKNLSKQVTAQVVQADLSTADGRKQVMEIIYAQAPDLVINNAGLGLYGDALSYSTEEQVAVLEVNGRAVLELTLEAARAMISAQKKGIVLNVSSVAGFQVMPTMSVYAASKAFVTQFSQALDFEVKKYGVRILTSCPGMVETDFPNRAGGKKGDREALGAMDVAYAAEQLWNQIEKQNALSIFNWHYRLLNYVSNIVPTCWIARIVMKNIEQRIAPRSLIKLNKKNENEY